MLIVAEQVAHEHGYIEVSRHEINALRDRFWGNQVLGVKAMSEGKQVKIKSCKYILPQFEEDIDNGKRRPKIDIDMHWGKPRLGIDLPDGTSCFLTYKDGKCSEAQAFGESGLSFAVSIQSRIEELIRHKTAYEQAKEKHPDALVLLRGKFYRLFDSDADIAAKVFGITVSVKDGRRCAMFPQHALDTYLPKLVRAGYRVVIVENENFPLLNE